MVQFKLAPRSTDDPDYANPEASPNIFVPVEGYTDEVNALYIAQSYEKRKQGIINKLGPDGVGVYDASKKNQDTLDAALKVHSKFIVRGWK